MLRVIAETEPESISVLAKTTGGEPDNPPRTLKTKSNYRIVDLMRERNLVRPIAKAFAFRIVAAKFYSVHGNMAQTAASRKTGSMKLSSWQTKN